jgi:hypothetical protein
MWYILLPLSFKQILVKTISILWSCLFVLRFDVTIYLHD